MRDGLREWEGQSSTNIDAFRNVINLIYVGVFAFSFLSFPIVTLDLHCGRLSLNASLTLQSNVETANTSVTTERSAGVNCPA